MKTRVSGRTNDERLRTATHWALMPLVAGVLIGMAFSTVFLVQPYTAITNIYLELPSEREDAAVSRLSEVKRMLSHLGVAHRSGAAKLADEASVKAAVYYAVVMNRRHSAEQLQVLRDTWTKHIAWQSVGYYIPKEEAAEDGANEEHLEDLHYGEIHSSKDDGMAVVELANTHSDFYMDVISHLCQTKLNDTKWFLLAGDDIYVKSPALEAHLHQYDNSPSFGYIGRPRSDGGAGDRECLQGPGTIISHTVLTELCHRIESCSEITTVGPGEVVGRCITKNLEQSCKDMKEEGKEEVFLQIESDVVGSVTEKANTHKLDSALTLYPVSDAKMMYSIHQSVVGRQINTTQHKIHSLKWALDRMTELLPHSDHSLKASYKEDIIVSSIEDIVSWKLVNHGSLLSDEENTPTRDVPGVWQLELEAMMDKAAQYLNVRDDSHHISKRIVNAYWKIDPLVGIHYITDFESSTQDENEIAQLKRHRVTFTRSLNPPEISRQPSPATAHITIVVCFSSDHVERLQQFMRRLEMALDRDQRINLVVVQMKSATEKQKPRRSQNLVDAKSILSLYRTKYQSASFTVLESPALLSRSHAIAIVLRESRPSEILFLADLNFDFNEGFLDRCRHLPAQGQQVYFPIIFSQANPALLASLNHTLMEGSVSQHSGHWLVSSYSTACLYAADLLAMSSQSELKGLLNEVDMVEVYRVLLEKGYEVVRAPDKQLKRVYSHDRTCDMDLVGFTPEESCKVKGDSKELEYLQTQLSALLFDHEGENSENKY